jgi:hypothetical protein
MPRARTFALAAAVLLVAIQAIPVERTNPPVESEPQAPPAVRAILERAGFDCHSHRTVWPLQAYLAPLSWLVAHDVKEGREELNFSTWGSYGAGVLVRKGQAIQKEVAEGEMPPGLYVLAHPGARLGAADKKALADWAASFSVPVAGGEGPGKDR